MSPTPLFGPATCGFHYIPIAVNVLRRDGSGTTCWQTCCVAGPSPSSGCGRKSACVTIFAI